MAYSNTIAIGVSPCLKACTISRLFDCGSKYSINEVLQAEKTIAATAGVELEALHRHFSFTKDSDDQHGILWQGLLLENRGQHKQACILFKKLLDSPNQRGISSWRISWYVARSAFKSGNINLAKNAIQKVIREKSDFEPAQNLFRELSASQP